MTSNLFRYTILGETLEESQNELVEKNNLRKECTEKIKDKFDEIANRHIMKENTQKEKHRNMGNTANISAIEHEFKFHDGVWSFQLKNVIIKMECQEISTETLKGRIY